MGDIVGEAASAAKTEKERMGYSDVIFELSYRDREVGTFPTSLGVEVTNHCNLRCPMCPREEADRGFANMDWELFTSLADQAVGQDKSIFMPQGFGESLIHPRFGEMLDYLHEKKVPWSMLVSNGTYLSEKNINKIIDAQVTFINVSLDGTVKETYEKIRPNAVYEDVVENVKNLFAIRKARGSQLPIISMRMIKMEGTEDDVAAYKAMWEPYLSEDDEIIISNYQTWSNSVEDRRVEDDASQPNERAVVEPDPVTGKKPPCRMLYKTLQVFHDGSSTPCCYDYNCTMEIGNAKTESVTDIWTGERAQHYRGLHEEGRMNEIPICRGCREYIP